tara:strand:+ start:6125 stop:6601 length:477 start_codon:yes stop_codon:yes gene_type:complete
MSNFLSKKLLSLNLVRKNFSVSIANYKPFIIINNLVYISGQLPIEEGNLKFFGKIDQQLSQKESEESVYIATKNLLWNLSDAIDQIKNLNSVKCLNIKGYINCTDNFKDHSKFLDITSDLIIKVLGNENGAHSRSVIGVNSLPKNSPVEIDAIFAIIN